jgi:hypothetical protein
MFTNEFADYLFIERSTESLNQNKENTNVGY